MSPRYDLRMADAVVRDSADPRQRGFTRSGKERPVLAVELFFDLVYVFAITQLSHLLVTRLGVDGAVQTAVLLGMVWQIWVYTTWMTNYLDPRQAPIRLALLVLMLASLVLAAFLPEAFADRGTIVALSYVVMQVGRGLFVVWALRGEQLQASFWRATAWSALAAVPMLAGAATDGHVREALWALAVAIELVGGAFGFITPGFGRSRTADWTIDGGHFAERCQAFVLIAFGESLIVTGTRLAEPGELPVDRVVAFAVAFAGSVALWWLYFDRAAEDSARVLAASHDPGRLARNAYHLIHPLIVGGIIVTASADEVMLSDPGGRGTMSTAWLVVGGAALYLGGHAAFKAVVWQVVSWPRIIAVAVLLALLALGRHMSSLALGAVALAVVVAVAIADRWRQVVAPH